MEKSHHTALHLLILQVRPRTGRCRGPAHRTEIIVRRVYVVTRRLDGVGYGDISRDDVVSGSGVEIEAVVTVVGKVIRFDPRACNAETSDAGVACASAAVIVARVVQDQTATGGDMNPPAPVAAHNAAFDRRVGSRHGNANIVAVDTAVPHRRSQPGGNSG